MNRRKTSFKFPQENLLERLVWIGSESDNFALLNSNDGTALAATDRIVRRVEGMLAKEENVDVWVAETGVSGSGDPLDVSSGAYNLARITVDFLPDKNMADPGEKIRVDTRSGEYMTRV